MIRARAPGKLILTGEYAVVYGAPAIVTSVNRHATVELRSGSGRRLTAPQLGLFDIDLNVHQGRESQLTRIIVDAVLGSTPGDLHIHIDTSGFVRDSNKLGLGSSAAVTVALWSALQRWVSPTWSPTDLTSNLGTLIELHRAHQGGRGSGIDVACAALGGTLRYAVGTKPQRVVWPPELEALAIYTGRAASTPAFLSRLDAVNPGVLQPALDALARGAETLARSFVNFSWPVFARDVEVFREHLAALGRVAGIDIMSAAHVTLSEIAADHDVAYKSSGAGGGDMGVCFANSPHSLAKLRDSARAAGFQPLQLRFDVPGAEVELVKNSVRL